MDFRVKKLILEEGMKNIAETEGTKLEMTFDDLEKTITAYFHSPLLRYTGGVRKTCSYDNLENASVDVFKTIEELRREVQAMKNPAAIGFMNGMPIGIHFHGNMDAITRSKSSRIPKIKNVIFNYPATIVFWADGDKTVVKCQGDDIFDPEKGLAMAIVKKMNGGKGNYCEIFKPWIEKYEKENTEVNDYTLKETIEHIVCRVNDLKKRLNIKSPSGIIQDILDGKVDPMMIKVDEEPEECRSEPIQETKEKALEPRKGSCLSCIHCDTLCFEEPCRECLTSFMKNNTSPNWEPAE